MPSLMSMITSGRELTAAEKRKFAALAWPVLGACRRLLRAETLTHDISKGMNELMDDFIAQEYVQPLSMALRTEEDPEKKVKLQARLDDFTAGRERRKEYWGQWLFKQMETRFPKNAQNQVDEMAQVVANMVEKGRSSILRTLPPLETDKPQNNFVSLVKLYTTIVKHMSSDAAESFYRRNELVRKVRQEGDQVDVQKQMENVPDTGLDHDTIERTIRQMWKYGRDKLTEDEKNLLHAFIMAVEDIGQKVSIKQIIARYVKEYGADVGVNLRNRWNHVRAVLKDFFWEEKGYIMPKAASKRGSMVDRLTEVGFRRSLAAWVLG